jgi:hypothetical protein
MKHILTLITTILLLLPPLAALPAAEPSIRLAEDGVARHAIVIEAGGTATEAERFAAEELALFLKKITGAAFSIVKESEYAGSGIYVGQTRKATELASILERWVRKNGCCNPPDEFLDSMARAEIDSQSSAEK